MVLTAPAKEAHRPGAYHWPRGPKPQQALTPEIECSGEPRFAVADEHPDRRP